MLLIIVGDLVRFPLGLTTLNYGVYLSDLVK